MDDHEVLLRIQELLDGVYWTPGTLSEIADVLIAAGYEVRDVDDAEVQS